MNPNSLRSQIGIGATDELSLRVSVGSLTRVLFEHPRQGDLMFALERKATLRKDPGHLVEVKSQPFGGALRVNEIEPLQNLIGNFHFDSEESRSEQDFRIFIRPSDWAAVQEFCLGYFGHPNNSVLETDPTRELTEEFADALGIQLERDQYSYQAVGIIVEDYPSATNYTYARGFPTARIYRIFEAHVLDSSLASAMINTSERYSDQDLGALALKDSRKGGPGRANAVLIVPFKEISAFYLAIPPERRNKPILFHNHQLDETVTAILDEVAVPKYRRL